MNAEADPFDPGNLPDIDPTGGLDEFLIFGEPDLRRVLTLYSVYYNETRTHLGLGKDAPLRRAVQRSGAIVTAPVLSGLHHRYARI